MLIKMTQIVKMKVINDPDDNKKDDNDRAEFENLWKFVRTLIIRIII